MYEWEHLYERNYIHQLMKEIIIKTLYNEFILLASLSYDIRDFYS